MPFVHRPVLLCADVLCHKVILWLMPESRNISIKLNSSYVKVPEGGPAVFKQPPHDGQVTVIGCYLLQNLNMGASRVHQEYR